MTRVRGQHHGAGLFLETRYLVGGCVCGQHYFMVRRAWGFPRYKVAGRFVSLYNGIMYISDGGGSL